jgi:hypothetical protein
VARRQGRSSSELAASGGTARPTLIGCFRCPWRLSRKVAVRLVEVIGVRGGRFLRSLRETEQSLSTREGRGRHRLGSSSQLGTGTAIPSNGSSTTR